MITALLCAIHVLSASSSSDGARTHGEVDDDRCADPDGRDEHEDGVRHRLLPARDRGLRDGGGRADREDQVLRVEPNGEHARARGLHRGEGVDRAHPLRSGRFLGAVRTLAELADRDDQQDPAQHDLRGAGTGRGAVTARCGGAGDREDDRAEDGQADQPADDEHRPVHTPACGHEHEHHRDDRDGAQRDPDRGGENLANCVPHCPPSSPRRRPA